MFNQT